MSEDEDATARIATLTGTGHTGEDRDELTGEQTGQWLVLSLSSAHFFDLDAGLVTRIPGYHAIEMVTDAGRPIRSIEQCKVGDVGIWTMEPFPHEHDLQFRWHRSSFIVRIVRIVGLERLPGLTPEGSREGI
jgi:hypothetical protein